MANAPMQFKRAVRNKVFIKSLIVGPSGGGKTYGALHLAHGLTTPDKIALADSENDRSLYYADRLVFDHISLPDYNPNMYMAAIDAAVAGGYEVLVLDSLTHAWQNILERKDQYDAAHPKEKFTSWNTFGGEWIKFVNYILFAPINILATARSKQAYEKVEGSGKVEKMGLQPILRDGTEYEFALVFDLSQTHTARATKDNTGRFDLGPTQMWDLTAPATSAELADWLKSGKPIAQPEPTTMKAIANAFAELEENGVATEKLRARYQGLLRQGLDDQGGQDILSKICGLMPSPTPIEDAVTAGTLVEMDAVLGELSKFNSITFAELSSVWNLSTKVEGVARGIINEGQKRLAARAAARAPAQPEPILKLA